MTQQELIKYLNSLIGVPYNRHTDYTTHSLETGFNCFTWCAFVYNLADKGDYKLARTFSDLRELHKYFQKVSPPYQFLDIALFTNKALEKRHIGVMLDQQYCIHCSSATNGVARADITRSIWANSLKDIYRYHEA
jgi:hypothetical protein